MHIAATQLKIPEPIGETGGFLTEVFLLKANRMESGIKERYLAMIDNLDNNVVTDSLNRTMTTSAYFRGYRIKNCLPELKITQLSIH